MEFQAAVATYVGQRPADLRERQNTQHEAFLDRFPISRWLDGDIELDDYALNTPDFRNSYSYFLEWGTPNLGSISGGSSHKHVIFKRNSGGWAYPSGYSDVSEAWAALKAGFRTMLDLAQNNDWASTSEIDILRGARTVRLKSLFLYFPSQVLPIYSHTHLVHFAQSLGLAPTGDTIDVNRRLLQHLRSLNELSEVDPLDFIGLLYGWNPPPGYKTPKYWKIAPGPGAKFWPECEEGGYICVGWDEIGDLTTFDSEDDFKERFASLYAAKYNGSKSALTQKARELWNLTQIADGDKVIANRGTSEVLAIGTVKDPGYQWRPDRNEYHHTINVEWDLDEARKLAEPVKKWALTTIAKIPSTQLDKLLNSQQPAIAPHDKDGISTDDELRFTDWNRVLERKGQVIFYGPPGTGKTHAAKGFAKWILKDQAPTEDYLTEVTFHASYAYEDFVEGFRPKQGAKDLTLELRDGILKRIATRATKDQGNRYVVIIDEINRADVPRVFGELMTVVEKPRRGERVLLPTSGEFLSIPTNLIILGTMNTADQSIRALDAALRRRFGFIELMPEIELLVGTVIDDLPLDQFVDELNRRITKLAGRERQIGHSFFLTDGVPIDATAAFADVVRTEIVPLLQEIVYDDYTQLREFLGSTVVDAAEQRLHAVVGDDAQLVAALAADFDIKAQTTAE
ncbi:McrB family protein [Gordonia sp. WA4-43]|uniref:McrB family protein n=1 Tax=Gordonia sp. WA4-43 TaxID=2878678 RepID=UPI001CF9EFE8|nr:AAA family ATPase [Gordonia sp. WA4-43]UCZ90705.1 AAA family ATPase [Gordonia sp. WA4-43]